jgi:glutamine amidotransferase-like uncharacterized protein
MRLLPLLLLVSASAFAATPCHIIESGRPGPTVLIDGRSGPAGAYAAEQIRHWRLAKGKLVIVAPAEQPEEVPADRRPANGLEVEAPDFHAEWRVRLADDVAALPAGTEPSSRLEAPANAPAAELATAVVEKMNAARSAELGACELAIALREEPAAPQTLTFTVRAPKRTLAIRAREERQFAHAVLQRLEMLAPGISTETIIGGDAPKRVAVYDGPGSAGAGVPNSVAQLSAQAGTAVARVCADDIAAGALSQFNTVMFTGGSGSKQSGTLGEAGRERVVEFVRGGGGYVGICAGSYLACKGFSWGLGILNAKTPSSKWQRGRGLVKIELNEQGHGILGEYKGEVDCRYGNGPILVPADAPDLPAFEPLALYRTELAENGSPKGVMVNSAAIVRAQFGAGRVLCISPHPEQTAGLEGVIPRAVGWVTPASAK